MKRAIHFLLFGAIFLAAFGAAVPSAQANGCTMQGAAGQYGFTLTGVLITATGAVHRPALPARVSLRIRRLSPRSLNMPV